MTEERLDRAAEVWVTVVGPTARADVALVAEAPCGACADELAVLLGESAPGPWALAPVDGPRCPASTTVRGAGIVDGSWLHLLDEARPWLRTAVPEAIPPAPEPTSSRFGTADPLDPVDPVSGARS